MAPLFGAGERICGIVGARDAVRYPIGVPLPSADPEIIAHTAFGNGDPPLADLPRQDDQIGEHCSDGHVPAHPDGEEQREQREPLVGIADECSEPEQ